MKPRLIPPFVLLCIALSACGTQVTEPDTGRTIKVAGPTTVKTERPTSTEDSTDTGPIKRSDQQRQKRADL